ncbi:MAG: SDR family NAD(P)-dependent oxidoreductase [Solirubrobacteraceae bacterium]
MVLEGKTAIVTGAARGQGAATAILAAKEGAQVVVIDVLDLGETVDTITKAGGVARPVSGDIRDAATWDEAVRIAEEELTGTFLLANVAGVTPLDDSVVGGSDETWQRTIDINLKGAWLGMRAALPAMLERGEGRVVNVASLAASHGVDGLSSYSASKGGLVALTRQVAVDYGKQGIRVNCINPGVIDTPMNEQNTPEMTEAFLQMTPVPRQGTAEDIAATIMFFASPGAEYITGQVLGVDGGWSVRS